MPTHAKEITKTAKCAHQNIQKGCQQRGKKYNYLPRLMTLEGLLDYYQCTVTSTSRLQLLHLKLPRNLPCPADCSSRCPLEAQGHPTIQKTHAGGPEGAGFSASNTQH